MKKMRVLFILVVFLYNVGSISAGNKRTIDNEASGNGVTMIINTPALTGFYTVGNDSGGSYPLNQTNYVPRDKQIRVRVTNTALKSYTCSFNAVQYGINVIFVDDASKELVFVASKRSAPVFPIKYTLTFENGETYTYDYYFNFEDPARN